MTGQSITGHHAHMKSHLPAYCSAVGGNRGTQRKRVKGQLRKGNYLAEANCKINIIGLLIRWWGVQAPALLSYRCCALEQGP